jgi:hypothetical protein
MKHCENCGNEHDESYGSGRFCTNKCARGFSTKAKREDINKSVSDKLTKHIKISKLCNHCLAKFEYSSNEKDRKYCSIKCSTQASNSNDNTKDKLSKARINSIKNGITNGIGTKSIYSFNDTLIHCDSNIERACIHYFEMLGATSIKRCERIIMYLHNDVNRRFLPDFEIILNDKVYIVEAKGYASTKILNDKWRNYNEVSILKKHALDEYCKNNDFISFWFTKDLNLNYYRSIK